MFDFFNTMGSQEVTTKRGFKKIKKIPYSLISELTPESKRLLKNIGALKSVKKEADVWSQEIQDNPNDTYENKAKGEEQEKILKNLYDLYKSKTEMSVNKKSFQETKYYENLLNENGERLYSDEELENAFKRDVGMALFYYQTEFIKNFPHLETKIPENVIKSILQKYIIPLPENTASEKNYKEESFKYINKTLKEKNRGDVIANPVLFKNKNINNSIIEELEQFVRYDYKVARNMKKEDVIPTLREEFVKKQEDVKQKEITSAKLENRNPKPIYTFIDRIDELFLQVGKAISGIMTIKREKGTMDLTLKIELLNKFSNLLSKLTGFNIQLEESKKYSINEIKNYLLKTKQNFIKKTLL